MRVHLIDGTYELFRHFYGVPSHRLPGGQEVGAVRGVVNSVLQLLEKGATHVGVATDHVIESFRNDLWPGYKTGEGIDPALWSQFELLEETLAEAGIVVWPMVEWEADDALAAAAKVAHADPRVEETLICTPDKDLAQCVTDDARVVQWDRRKDLRYDRAAVIAKFGVPPASIPDYLALVGDSADGFPGLPGFGPRTAALLLARYGHLENIPAEPARWEFPMKGAARLAETLAAHRDEALLFRRLATLRTDAPTIARVEELRWTGPRPGFAALCARLEAPRLAERAQAALAATVRVPPAS